MNVFLKKKANYYQRQRENRLWISKLYFELFDYVELLDLYVGKLRDKKESNRRNEKRFQYFRVGGFELKKIFNIADLQENLFQFIRCWVEPHKNSGQRLIFQIN